MIRFMKLNLRTKKLVENILSIIHHSINLLQRRVYKFYSVTIAKNISLLLLQYNYDFYFKTCKNK